MLSDLVSECLDQADTDGYHSIAFPPFGTGYLSYPTPRVADIMLECIEDFTSRTLTTVYIVIYSQESSCFQVNRQFKVSFLLCLLQLNPLLLHLFNTIWIQRRTFLYYREQDFLNAASKCSSSAPLQSKYHIYLYFLCTHDHEIPFHKAWNIPVLLQ